MRLRLALVSLLAALVRNSRTAPLKSSDVNYYNVISDSKDSKQSGPSIFLPGLGSIQGSLTKSLRGNKTIYQYQGIPFAEPPIGTKRFKAPVPAQPWMPDILDATSPGKTCIQIGIDVYGDLPTDDEQSEACLTLNVYTPEGTDPNSLLPVLFFIHGGGFALGSARTQVPHALLDHDFILVCPQYRLGPFGFLNLQVDDVPGNAGLLDQVEALRWVNKHIAHFGGDPNRVTIGGHSAGAASASLLHLSPLTKGLFDAVMPMSGSALAFWAWDHTPEIAGHEISDTLNCPPKISERVECLQNVSAEDLTQAFASLALTSMLRGEAGMSGTTPSVQKAGVIRFLDDLPENIMNRGEFPSVPLMTGVAKHEGIYVMQLAKMAFLLPHGYDKDPDFLRYELLNVLLNLTGLVDPTDFVFEAVKKRYMDPDTMGDLKAMEPGLIDLTGSFAFKSPALKLAIQNSLANGTSYLYVFNHYDSSANEGIPHGAEQRYLFPHLPPEMTKSALSEADDEKIARILIDVVANFVINHVPSTSWPAITRGTENYLDISMPLKVRTGFSRELTIGREEGIDRPNPNIDAPISENVVTPVAAASDDGSGGASGQWAFFSSTLLLSITAVIILH